MYSIIPSWEVVLKPGKFKKPCSWIWLEHAERKFYTLLASGQFYPKNEESRAIEREYGQA